MNPKAFAKEWFELLSRTSEWGSVHAHMLRKIRGAGKLSQLSFVLRMLRSMLYASAGIVPALVSSARPIDVKAFAAQVLGGKAADITTKEDPSLIAGAVLETDELRIDASLRGQLHALHEQMKLSS